jgi:hypothetical protein
LLNEIRVFRYLRTFRHIVALNTGFLGQLVALVAVVRGGVDLLGFLDGGGPCHLGANRVVAAAVVEPLLGHLDHGLPEGLSGWARGREHAGVGVAPEIVHEGFRALGRDA